MISIDLKGKQDLDYIFYELDKYFNFTYGHPDLNSINDLMYDLRQFADIDVLEFNIFPDFEMPEERILPGFKQDFFRMLERHKNRKFQDNETIIIVNYIKQI